MFKRRPYQTARAVLAHQHRFLLAVHSSFWARKVRRWGLPGGGIERGEDPQQAVRRELREELYLHADQMQQFRELGAYAYKGADHMIYGARTLVEVKKYDRGELLDLRWFELDEIVELQKRRRLHAGYELQAIQQFIDSTE